MYLIYYLKVIKKPKIIKFPRKLSKIKKHFTKLLINNNHFLKLIHSKFIIKLKKRLKVFNKN